MFQQAYCLKEIVVFKYKRYNIYFLQAMAEMMAENYHNIWAKKKKMELEAKG